MKDIKKYFIAGFDVLGYSNRVREGDKTLFVIINDSVNFVKQKLAQKYDFQYRVFSDNFLFCSEHNCEGVLLAAAFMQAKLACSGIFTRGVLIHDDLIITNDFVYGESIIRANEVEKNDAIYPRIIVDKPFMAHIQAIKAELEIAGLYLAEDDKSVFYIDYLEVLKSTDKDDLHIEMKYGDTSKSYPVSFNDELDAHRYYIEEELVKHEERLERAILGGKYDDIKAYNGIKGKFLWVKRYHNQFCTKHNYFQHLIISNMRGKTFDFNNTEINCLDCDFNIDLSKRSFNIVVSDPEIIDKGFIHNLAWRERILKSEYVFGEDIDTGLKFTLFGCQICLNRQNMKSPEKDGSFYIDSAELIIFWDSIIIGQHIACIDKLRITDMFVLAESKKQEFSHSVNKICYKIENGTIDVDVNFFEVKRKLYESWNIARKGCLFRLKSLQPVMLSDMKKSYKQLLDLYYLMVGHYPDNTRFWCDSELGNFLHISHLDGFSKSKNRDISYERSLCVSNMCDLSQAYDKWILLYGKITPIITVFKNAVSDNNAIQEMLTATFIQCLEAYFRQTHNCQSDDLSTVILKAVNFNDFTKKVIQDIDSVFPRIVEHRKAADKLEFPSNGNYFKNHENTSVSMKLELLLRLCLLHDVGLNVKEDSIADYVAMLNRKFPM